MSASHPAAVAFLYPGQGSQYPGMGKAVYEASAVAREVFEQADGALPFSISDLCFNADEATLRRTEITQPAILAVSAALDRVLESRGLRPGWVAGHSLGEYSALVAAGSLDVATATRLVHDRGRYMHEAVPEGSGAMAAVIGLEVAVVEELCAAQRGDQVLEIANLNAPGQVVVAGHREAVEALAGAAGEAGARRVIMLNVSAPFHCRLMQPAADRLIPQLRAVELADPVFPVVCNVDARPVTDGAAARDALERQVTRPVRWSETLEYLAAQGVEVFVEVGPGTVLSGLVKRTLGRGVDTYNVDEVERIDAVVASLS